MKQQIALIVLAFALPQAASAFKGGGQDNKVVINDPAPQHVQPVLREIDGVVSWKTLADMTASKENNRVVQKFSGKVTALDKQEVKLQGFMLPLEVGSKQAHFFLTATPPTCGFCAPGGPDEMVEVQAKSAIKYSIDAVVISGRFELVKNDPSGLLYRLTDAVSTGN